MALPLALNGVPWPTCVTCGQFSRRLFVLCFDLIFHFLLRHVSQNNALRNPGAHRQWGINLTTSVPNRHYWVVCKWASRFARQR